MSGNLDSPPDDGTKRFSLDEVLKGKTLQVYTYMLRKKEPVGVREIQRDLSFSSPSVASYHIEKLVELSLISQDQFGRYYIVQRVQVGVLQAFVNIAGYAIPRLSFFAAFFTTMLVTYLVLKINDLDVYAIGFVSAGAVAFWIETVRIWTKRPFT